MKLNLVASIRVLREIDCLNKIILTHLLSSTFIAILFFQDLFCKILFFSSHSFFKIIFYARSFLQILFFSSHSFFKSYFIKWHFSQILIFFQIMFSSKSYFFQIIFISGSLFSNHSRLISTSVSCWIVNDDSPKYHLKTSSHKMAVSESLSVASRDVG